MIQVYLLQIPALAAVHSMPLRLQMVQAGVVTRMRKLLFPIAIMLIPIAAKAQTTGAPLNLALPNVHAPNWNVPLNANFTTINSSYNLLAPKANPVFTNSVTLPIAGSTQCLHVNSTGVVSGTGADCGAGGGSGFPITLGSTSIAASSTTTAVTGLSVNGVTLQSGGSSSLFLNQAGAYVSAGGGGAVSSVSNSDGTLTISPTTGAIVGSLNLAHANNWTGAVD